MKPLFCAPQVCANDEEVCEVEPWQAVSVLCRILAAMVPVGKALNLPAAYIFFYELAAQEDRSVSIVAPTSSLTEQFFDVAYCAVLSVFHQLYQIAMDSSSNLVYLYNLNSPLKLLRRCVDASVLQHPASLQKSNFGARRCRWTVLDKHFASRFCWPVTSSYL